MKQKLKLWGFRKANSKKKITFYFLLFLLVCLQLFILFNQSFAKSLKQKVSFDSLTSSSTLPPHIKVIALVNSAEGEEKQPSESAINKLTTKLVSLNYFTVIEREKIDKILAEQAFSNSGFVDETKAVELGKLLGAEGIILLSVHNYKVEETKGSDTVYDENKNPLQRPYTVKNGFVSASIKLVDVTTGTVLLADDKSETVQYKEFDISQITVGDAITKLFVNKKTKITDTAPDNYTILNNLLDKVLEKLTSGVLPHFTKKERLLEANFASAEPGINLALSGQWDKALKLWENVYIENPNDATIWADMGIGYEALGCFERAVEKYQKAVELNPANKHYIDWITEAKTGTSKECNLNLNQTTDTASNTNTTPQNLEPMVVKIDKDKIYIDLGTDNGLKEGEKLIVYEKKVTVHPITSKVIGEEKLIKAELTVVQLFPQMAICKISSGDKNIAVGNLVMRR